MERLPNRKKVLGALSCLSCVTVLGLITTFLAQPPSRTEEIRDALKNSLPPQTFCPPAADRKFWDAVKKSADAPKQTPPPTDKKPLEPRKAMTQGTRQECLYHTGEWTPVIEAAILQLLEEPWSDQELFRTEFVDLFATDTAATIAFTLCSLKDEIRPEVRAAAIEKIQSKIIQPYLKDLAAYQKKHLQWKFDMCPWLETKNNWNAVCISNIIYTVLAISPDRNLQAKIIAGSEEALQDYFATFEKDGYLSSGIRYWNYGFSHLVILAERLLLASNGKIDLYKMSPIIDKIIEFPLKWEVYQKGGKFYYPLFADNKNPTPGQTWVWDILKRRFTIDIPITPDTPPKPIWENDNVVVDLLLNPPKAPTKKTEIAALDPTEARFFPSMGALISKAAETGITIAVKGGTNHEEHNHNDIGAYTLFEFGTAISGDLGGIPYTRDTTGKGRYTFDVQSSYGHPLPVIDGQLQHNENKAKAKVLASRFTQEKDEITYDLTTAYNVEGLTSLTRKVTFEKKPIAKLTVEDSFQSERPIQFETALIFSKPIQITENKIIGIPQKESFITNVSSTQQITIEKTTLQNDQSSEETLRRCALAFKEKTTAGTIRYTIEKSGGKP